MKAACWLIYVLLILGILLTGCRPASPHGVVQKAPLPDLISEGQPGSAGPTGSLSTQTLSMAVQTSSLVVFATPSDQAAAEDVAKAIQAQQNELCDRLSIDCSFWVKVEIYPSQASFDEHAMNPDMRGFYAISGQRTIQMVSPRLPPGQRDIPYEERVRIAVHEYAHLALNEVTRDLPDWLAEGAAVYLGPHNLYDQACQQSIPRNMAPRLQDLLESYENVPAADFFAYTLVRYIAETEGLDALYSLIRAPADFPNRSAPDLEARWHNFIENNCVQVK